MGIPLGLLLLPVIATVVMTIAALRRRDARKTTELWRKALAQLEVTSEQPALRVEHRDNQQIDAYITAAFRGVAPARTPEPSDDEALTDLSITSLKKQMEVTSRARLARGSQPPPLDTAWFDLTDLVVEESRPLDAEDDSDELVL
jgi:hypothetical protein